ncbi:NUDIX hydrolase [Gottfriedia sp. NPDC057948]|uniref:NUDIX hydrolase n=1 Tax=Gottfriedia sp. NPDC057948 TaxID=3346287 RepID=UPI0036D86204
MGYIMDLRKVVGSRPLLMVGANVILLDSQKRVLLQLRKDNNTWGLPAGSLELGENLEETAKRELKEETGLTALKLEFFNIFSGKEFYYKYPHGDEVYNVIATYICTEYSGVLEKEESEVQDLRFFSFNELPSEISPPELPIIKSFKDSLFN